MVTFEQSMSSLSTLELIRRCELQECQAATQNQPHPQAATHLLALLLENDLLEARYLWQRLSATCRSNPLILSAYALISALYVSDYPTFYNTASSTDWGSLSPLIAKAVEDARKRALKLIEKAFTCISIENMKLLLGVDDNTAKEMCKTHDWELNDGFVEVKRKYHDTIDETSRQNYMELQRLTEQLVKLQTTS